MTGNIILLCVITQVGDAAAILGFVGAPWTLATYIIEGKTTRTYTTIKSMCYQSPKILRALLSHLAREIANYMIFQIKQGAQCIQIFDSWGGQLTPEQWDLWSKPYIQQVMLVTIVLRQEYRKEYKANILTF